VRLRSLEPRGSGDRGRTGPTATIDKVFLLLFVHKKKTSSSLPFRSAPIPSSAAYLVRLDPSPEGTLRVVVAGAWSIGHGLAPELPLDQHISQTKLVAYDTGGVTEWDSSLIELLFRIERWAAEHKIPTDRTSLAPPMAHLLELALATPAQHTGRHIGHKPGRILANLGLAAIGPWRNTQDLVQFMGEVVLAAWRLATGQSTMRPSDFWAGFDSAGPKALPIVSLVALLIGLIMGFIGAVQLRRFGAEIYVANLVGIAMTREMGALMSGVIMSGRTGAAYAANLGTMKANDEISALQTTGLDPIEFLVLPRVLALMLALPLLVVFADLIGILGGLSLGTLMLHLDAGLYFTQIRRSIGLDDVFLGLVKSVFFGAILGIVGCWCGLNAARNAQGVGDATTTAVVLGIVLILATDAIFTVITTIVGI